MKSRRGHANVLAFKTVILLSNKVIPAVQLDVENKPV